MMTKLRPWTKLPNSWIEQKGLHEFRWHQNQGKTCGADETVALMALTAIANHADEQTGIAHLTYDRLCEITSRSRKKMSEGLKVLKGRELIETDGRSTYKLGGYDPKIGWAKLPAHGLYHNDVIKAFKDFHLRQAGELEALKLYFLFASRRDRQTNLAQLSYDKIEEYAGVKRHNIRKALTILGVLNLIHVEHGFSLQNEEGVSNAYRLAHLESYKHMGTIGRRLISEGGIGQQESA
jgi:hypothetical protein